MRLIIVYDFPMQTREDYKIYQMFHKRLIQLGFSMMQYSMYSKVLLNDSSYEQLITKIQGSLPNQGNIILFRMTEKQYQDILFLRGVRNKQELVVGSKELVVIGRDEN